MGIRITVLTTDSHLNCKSNIRVNYTSFILFGVIDASLPIVNCKLLIVNYYSLSRFNHSVVITSVAE